MEHTNHQELADAMLLYAQECGCAVTTLGARARCGGNFYERLLAGKRIWPETKQKVWDYMANNPVKKEGTAA